MFCDNKLINRCRVSATLSHASAVSFIWFMGCLHDPANVQQTSSKWTFAGSCKHLITGIKCSYRQH